MPSGASGEIRVEAAGEALSLSWADGSAVRLAATTLRRACRCAACAAAQARGTTVRPEPVTIAAVRAVGGYAINVSFSDGHDRGIFPWNYLAELAERDRGT